MSRMTMTSLAASTALILGLAVSPLYAKDKCPPGLAKQGRCGVATAPTPSAKPQKPAKPGKSEKAAKPAAPVAAKPTVAAITAKPGTILGNERFIPVLDPRLFGLSAATAGTAYYLVGDQIVRATVDGYKVVDVVRPVSARDCPPGLAKKEPACIPPGQVDKIVKGGWDANRFTRIDDLTRYDLPAPDGNWDYYSVDGTIVRVDRTTRDILGVVRLIDALTN